MRHVVLAVISAAAATASTPSRACGSTEPVYDTAFPFEGHTVPRNATLGAVSVDDTIYGELVADDGVVRRVAWSDDDARFPPRQTSTITVRVNLDAAAPITAPFDPLEPQSTSSQSVSTQLFDAQGLAIEAIIFFSAVADDIWEYNLMTDGANQTGGTPGVLTQLGSGQLSFNGAGLLVEALVLTDNFLPRGSSFPQPLTIDFGTPLTTDPELSTTQLAGASSTVFIGQDGHPSGDGLLSVGRQVLTLFSTEDDNISRDIIFGVDDVLDTDAAAVSLSITRRIGGDSALGQENPCASTPWPTTFATIAIESGGEDAAFIQLQSGERLRLFNGALEINETNRDLSGLVVVDFAGNASTPEVVEAGTGDGTGGCGCQSNNASSVAGLGVLAALLRRRRR